MIKSTKYLIISQKNNIKTYRSSHNKNSKIIRKTLEAKLVKFRIDKVRYHGSDFEGTSIVLLFQNAEKIFKQFFLKLKNSLLMIFKK